MRKEEKIKNITLYTIRYQTRNETDTTNKRTNVQSSKKVENLEVLYFDFLHSVKVKNLWLC